MARSVPEPVGFGALVSAVGRLHAGKSRPACPPFCTNSIRGRACGGGRPGATRRFLQPTTGGFAPSPYRDRAGEGPTLPCFFSEAHDVIRVCRCIERLTDGSSLTHW